MLRACAEEDVHVLDRHPVKRRRQPVRALADPARAAVHDPPPEIDRCPVRSKRDVAGLDVDPDARGLERPPSRVHGLRVVAEEREVGRVAARAHAGGDRIDQA